MTKTILAKPKDHLPTNRIARSTGQRTQTESLHRSRRRMQRATVGGRGSRRMARTLMMVITARSRERITSSRIPLAVGRTHRLTLMIKMRGMRSVTLRWEILTIGVDCFKRSRGSLTSNRDAERKTVGKMASINVKPRLCLGRKAAGNSSARSTEVGQKCARVWTRKL